MTFAAGREDQLSRGLREVGSADADRQDFGLTLRVDRALWLNLDYNLLHPERSVSFRFHPGQFGDNLSLRVDRLN